MLMLKALCQRYIRPWPLSRLNFSVPFGRASFCPDGMHVELTEDKNLSCVNEFSKNEISVCFKIRVLQIVKNHYGPISPILSPILWWTRLETNFYQDIGIRTADKCYEFHKSLKNNLFTGKLTGSCVNY